MIAPTAAAAGAAVFTNWQYNGQYASDANNTAAVAAADQVTQIVRWLQALFTGKTFRNCTAAVMRNAKRLGKLTPVMFRLFRLTDCLRENLREEEEKEEEEVNCNARFLMPRCSGNTNFTWCCCCCLSTDLVTWHFSTLQTARCIWIVLCSALNQTKSYQCHSTGKQIFTFSYFFFCCIVFIFWWNVSQGQACERLQFCSEQLSFDLLPSTRAVQCGKVRRRRRILGTFSIDHYFLVTVELSRIHRVFVRLLERDETTLCAALGAQHIYFD